MAAGLRGSRSRASSLTDGAVEHESCEDAEEGEGEPRGLPDDQHHRAGDQRSQGKVEVEARVALHLDEHVDGRLYRLGACAL